MRRNLTTLAIFLLLGAVLNVAVAWACLLWLDHSGRITKRPPNESDLAWWQDHALEGMAVPHETELIPGFGYYCLRLHAPARRVKAGFKFVESSSSLSAGLPMRALSCEWFSKPAPQTARWFDTVHRYAISTVDSPVFSLWPDRAPFLPLRPVWPGFALNPFFYATILWLLVRGPVVLRRVVRRRSGRCPDCGYPVGVSPVCTECGQPLPRLP